MLIKYNNSLIKYKIEDCDQSDLISFYICKKKYLSFRILYNNPCGLKLYFYYKDNVCIISCYKHASFIFNNKRHKEYESRIIIDHLTIYRIYRLFLFFIVKT